MLFIDNIMKKFLLIVLPIFFLLSLNNKAKAQNYQLHAVFINNFIKHVKWPENQNTGEFKIAVLGNSPILEHLVKLAEVRKINGRNIVIEEFSSLEQVKNVHMLYIPESHADILDRALVNQVKSSTMIITEKEGLGQKGSNINFIIRNGRLAFEMNLAAMEKSNLKVASELARLAIEI